MSCIDAEYCFMDLRVRFAFPRHAHDSFLCSFCISVGHVEKLNLKIISTYIFLDAQWHNREDVKKALTFAEYQKAQRTAAVKVEQMCKGVEKGQNLAADFNVESGELATMFVPGPFAIAHHLISSWVYQDSFNGVEAHLKLHRSGSMSSL